MKRNLEKGIGVLFFILAIFTIVQSAGLSIGGIHNPGPGFMPFVLGLSMAVLSLLSFLLPGEEIPRTKEGKIFPYLFIILTSYVLLIGILGFYLSTFLLMVCFMRLSGEKWVGSLLSFCVSALMVVYILFGRLLMIPFPRGLLGI